MTFSRLGCIWVETDVACRRDIRFYSGIVVTGLDQCTSRLNCSHGEVKQVSCLMRRPGSRCGGCQVPSLDRRHAASRSPSSHKDWGYMKLSLRNREQLDCGVRPASPTTRTTSRKYPLNREIPAPIPSNLSIETDEEYNLGRIGILQAVVQLGSSASTWSRIKISRDFLRRKLLRLRSLREKLWCRLEDILGTPVDRPNSRSPRS